MPCVKGFACVNVQKIVPFQSYQDMPESKERTQVIWLRRLMVEFECHHPTGHTSHCWAVTASVLGNWRTKWAVRCLMLFCSKKVDWSLSQRCQCSAHCLGGNIANILNTHVSRILQTLSVSTQVCASTYPESPKALLRKGSMQPSFLSYKCIKMEAQRIAHGHEISEDRAHP